MDESLLSVRASDPLSQVTQLRLAAVYSFRPGGRQAAHDLLTLGLDAISDPGGQRSQPANHRSRHAASTHPALNFDGYLS